MTPAKCEIAMQSQSGIAKKVYECVPVQQPWQTFQIATALKNMTGSQADVRVVQGCLNDLVDSGLIRETQRRYYQRIQVEEKKKPPEPKMPAAANKPEVVAVEPRKAAALEVLVELATEVVGVADHIKRIAERMEDCALAIEQEREASTDELASLRQLKNLLKSIGGAA